ncbi:MAG: type IV toxin-antitoxin system AbiEi family antitoxin domain-containing protein [Candidatus Woesearchaeota archaeon]
MDAIKGLSKIEIEIISSIEFSESYFFTIDQIEKYFTNENQRYNIIKRLMKKGRIIKLNNQKYYLIPIKAKKGFWSEHNFIIIDEIMDSKDYYIGGWSAAYYWKLTDQLPMRDDVYSTKKYGKKKIMNKNIIFHRIRKEALVKAVKRKIAKHSFYILSKKETKKWMESKK